MIIKTRLTVNSVVLAGTGLGLLLVGFLLLLEPAERGAVAWLDFVICGVVFLFNFATMPIVQPRSSGFSGEIPKLGILWTTHITYTFLSMAGIWYGWISGIPFRFQLLYHLALLFGVLSVVSLAGKAADHADRVATAEQHKRDSLQTLQSAISDCDAAFLHLGNGRPTEYAEFQRIKDDVRYLSPCEKPGAVSLDLELACMLEDLCGTLSSSDQFPGHYQGMRDLLTRCRTLVQLRKQERNV